MSPKRWAGLLLVTNDESRSRKQTLANIMKHAEICRCYRLPVPLLHGFVRKEIKQLLLPFIIYLSGLKTCHLYILKGPSIGNEQMEK